jgi:hypothetical protein
VRHLLGEAPHRRELAAALLLGFAGPHALADDGVERGQRDGHGDDRHRLLGAHRLHDREVDGEPGHGEREREQAEPGLVLAPDELEAQGSDGDQRGGGERRNVRDGHRQADVVVPEVARPEDAAHAHRGEHVPRAHLLFALLRLLQMRDEEHDGRGGCGKDTGQKDQIPTGRVGPEGELGEEGVGDEEHRAERAAAAHESRDDVQAERGREPRNGRVEAAPGGVAREAPGEAREVPNEKIEAQKGERKRHRALGPAEQKQDREGQMADAGDEPELLVQGHERAGQRGLPML